MMKKVIYSLLALSPILTFAQDLGKVDTLVDNLRVLFSDIVPLIFAVGVIYFLWGLAKFVKTAGGGDAKAHEAGRSHMIYGILALVIMVSLYGIINWVSDTADLNNAKGIDLPDLKNANI